jgi:hypothetical protein
MASVDIRSVRFDRVRIKSFPVTGRGARGRGTEVAAIAAPNTHAGTESQASPVRKPSL